MDDGDRGVDGTVIKASAEDEHVLEAFRMEQLPSLVKSHKYMFKEAFDLEGVEEQDWPLTKIEVKKLDETDSNTRVAQVPPLPENATDPPSNLSSMGEPSTSKSIRLLIRYPRVSSRSHCGRATKGFVALDMDEMKLKFLKDRRRYDDDRYFHPELEVYKKLGAANVKNIAKVEGVGDVVDEDGEIQFTIADQYLSAWGTNHFALAHYRLLIRQLGTPLKNYSRSLMLCYYLLQALNGHEGAFKAGVLHCDISPNNIMVDEAPGGGAFLIDWDFCRYVDELDKYGTTRRTGTWAFISSLLLKYPSKRHELADDLESFIHVLHWFCLQFHAHDLTRYQISTTLSWTYYGSYYEGRYELGGDNKMKIMQEGEPPFRLQEGEVSPVLIDLVDEISSLCRNHYATVNYSALEASSAKLFKKDGKKPEESESTMSPVSEETIHAQYLLVTEGLKVKFSKRKLDEAANVLEDRPSGSNVRKKRKKDDCEENDKTGANKKPAISPFATHDLLIAAFQTVLNDKNLWYFDKQGDQFDFTAPKPNVHKTTPVIYIDKPQVGCKYGVVEEFVSVYGEPPQKRSCLYKDDSENGVVVTALPREAAGVDIVYLYRRQSGVAPSESVPISSTSASHSTVA
ncbi:hypothetical protein ABKN59_009738 [Abortiporus biennis]